MNYRNKKILQLAKECPSCLLCHKANQGREWSKEFRKSNWERAHRSTIGWLFENGHLEVK